MKFMKLSFLFAVLAVFYVHGDDQKKTNIGLCIAATGRYVSFIPPLLDSARKYFFANDTEFNVTYFIFTDQDLKQPSDTVVIYQKKLGWPYDSMFRYDMYLGQKDALSTMDYVFSCDADMIFVDFVDKEILSERVAVMHPDSPDWQTCNERPYDRNKKSMAYFAPGEGEYYVAGAFYGGTAEEFLKLCKTNIHNVRIDLANGVNARFDDESHNNRYFFNNKPSLILPSQYCCPKHLTHRFPGAKIMTVAKNETTMRK